MSDRDELAEIIWENTDGTDEDAPDVAADKIIAAGWRKVAPPESMAEYVARLKAQHSTQTGTAQ